MRTSPYVSVSGVAINSNKLDGFFDINASQYTAHYKNDHALSVFPVCTHFNSNKYKTKKPLPSNNSFVYIEGFLENIDYDSTGHATTFHVSVDNISFLGKATVSHSQTDNSGNCLFFLFDCRSTDSFRSLNQFVSFPLRI